jgi:hypothetical protein
MITAVNKSLENIIHKQNIGAPDISHTKAVKCICTASYQIDDFITKENCPKNLSTPVPTSSATVVAYGYVLHHIHMDNHACQQGI